MFKMEYFNYFLPLNLRNVYQGNDFFEIIFKNTSIFVCVVKGVIPRAAHTQDLCFTTEIYTQPQNKV